MEASRYQYPRTDPTVIMGIVSPDGEGLLLGRQKKWPPGKSIVLATLAHIRTLTNVLHTYRLLLVPCRLPRARRVVGGGCSS